MRTAAGGRRPDDSGQLTIGLVTVVMVGLLFLAVSYFLPLGEATDQKASSRAAADAAALAAAEQIQNDLASAVLDAVDQARTVEDLPGVLDSLTGGFGREQAGEYADRNGADLVGYQYTRASGRIWAQVRHRQPASTGDRAQSSATAELGIRLGACRLAEPDEPDQPDEPDEPGTAEVLCGDLELQFEITGDDGKPSLKTDLDDLFDDLEPRLIS
ncbi:hypothetical protein LWF15_02145 [Kineosporia rhizophila]|uniref:hypothetical protein n=1 Tax=Kineosporia rhizophila TaxID=84633 RepID=UPI001E536A68|nr:hypothetical protein [Kineosporia rhizophila]MCE0534300.1 hypothetical protein [Kineosporia rhizophila]